MPIQSIVRLYDGGGVEIGIRLNGVGKDGFFEILYADIPGNSWNQNRLNKFTQRAQDLIDVRIPLADLPADDPAKTTDPARPDQFWDGTDLVGRNVIISEVFFDGSLFFTLTRARPSL